MNLRAHAGVRINVVVGILYVVDTTATTGWEKPWCRAVCASGHRIESPAHATTLLSVCPCAMSASNHCVTRRAVRIGFLYIAHALHCGYAIVRRMAVDTRKIDQCPCGPWDGVTCVYGQYNALWTVLCGVCYAVNSRAAAMSAPRSVPSLQRHHG
jgi:hypothetical protein